MTLPNIFATLPGGDVPASKLDQNFAILEGAILQGVTSTGVVNNYVLTPTDAWVTGYSGYSSIGLNVKFNISNTGPVSVNVSGLGTASIVKNVGGVATPLAAGDIFAGIPYLITCDGTQFWITLPAGVTTTLPNIRGLRSVNNTGTPDTKIDITASAAQMVNTGNGGLVATSISVTIDATTTGANGLDTGALANATWYYLYLISNGTVTAGLASLSSTAPTLPSGYTYFVRTGAIITDGSAHFKRFQQIADETVYAPVAATTTASYPQMWTGAKGTFSTTPTWASQDVSLFYPPTAASIKFIFNSTSSTNGAGMVSPNNVASGNTGTNPPVLSFNASGGNGESILEELVLTTTNTLYAATLANTAVYAYGWRDSIAI